MWAPSAETDVPGRTSPPGSRRKDRRWPAWRIDFRPHFFGGVATVVAKLLLQCLPDIAVFGEKDYQQLMVVTQLAKDLAIPVKIVGGRTVRERDGLALSSRNAYLSAGERAVAPALYRVLRRCADAIRQGRPIGTTLAHGRKEIERSGFVLDYLEACHAETLTPVRQAKTRPCACS